MSFTPCSYREARSVVLMGVDVRDKRIFVPLGLETTLAACNLLGKAIGQGRDKWVVRAIFYARMKPIVNFEDLHRCHIYDDSVVV